MCGLFGWQFNPSKLPSKRQRRRLAMALAHHMDKRGGQAWGVVVNGSVFKGLGDAQDRATHFKRAVTLMGHTRYATHGDKTNLEHAHPFASGDILLSHNGVISNHRDLNTKYQRTHEVDSQHILSHLVEGLDFSEIQSYGATTWLDVNDCDSVRIARLAERGDMAIAQIPGGVVWASTKEAVTDACDFAGLVIEFWYEVDVGSVYIAERGQLFIDKAHRSLKVSEPATFRDWRWGSWLDNDDDDVRWSAVRPTPPSNVAYLHHSEADFYDTVDSMAREVEVSEARMFIEEYAGVSPAAFDGMTEDDILNTAFDMGWPGVETEMN